MNLKTRVAGWLAAPQVQAAREVLGAISLKTWAMILLALAVGIQTWRLNSAQHKIELHAAEVEKWSSANAANVRAIRLLKEANEAWARAADKRGQKAKDAVADLEEWKRAHSQQPEKSKQERRKIYERNPDAAQWGRTVVPSELERVLRQ